jgi:hypothetical protein
MVDYNRANRPWFAVRTNSRTDIDASSGSTAALQSIYGSQASQLPIAPSCTAEDDLYWSRSTPALITRPKSAPPKPLNRQRIASARPHTITQVGAKRPKSAAVQVLPYQSQHKSNKKDKRVRPTTAQPLRRYSSIESQTTAVTAEKVKNKTVPVALTSVPQYFNFWLEKPLLPKTWEVPTHQRKSRRRPRSEYGTRGISGRQGKKDNIGRSRESGDDGGDKDNGILNQVMSGILLETDDHDNMLKMRRRRRSDDSDEDDIMRLIDEDNENSWMKGNDKSLHDDNMSNRLNSLNSTNE